MTEKDIVKENRIKCVECKQEFKVKDNEFKSNNFLKKLLNNHDFLSDEEFELKNQIEDSIRQFFQSYEQFTSNKTIRDLNVHNHFTEIRFQLDEHRELLKEKVDDIYMEMINKTKKFEVVYLKSLEDRLEASLKSFESKTLEQTLKDTEELFRMPNLLIESIREMQRKQEEAIAELKLKLNEQNQVRDHLIKMNEFKPNLSFSQDLFGQLRLNEYSSNDLFQSQILAGHQPTELIKLCEFSSDEKWTLLYRGSRDGFGAADFHSKCDDHSNTLTIFKAKGSSYIFGGFASITWESSGGFKSDPNAFLFSLTNKDSQPCKMKQIDTNQSIYCFSDYGPIFGDNDFYICDFANTTADSGSDLGNSYQHPQPNQGQSFLAGSSLFQLSEIEVYKKE